MCSFDWSVRKTQLYLQFLCNPCIHELMNFLLTLGHLSWWLSIDHTILRFVLISFLWCMFIPSYSDCFLGPSTCYASFSSFFRVQLQVFICISYCNCFTTLNKYFASEIYLNSLKLCFWLTACIDEKENQTPHWEEHSFKEFVRYLRSRMPALDFYALRSRCNAILVYSFVEWLILRSFLFFLVVLDKILLLIIVLFFLLGRVRVYWAWID